MTTLVDSSEQLLVYLETQHTWSHGTGAHNIHYATISCQGKGHRHIAIKSKAFGHPPRAVNQVLQVVDIGVFDVRIEIGGGRS
jgi:hypothetical protein